MIDGYQLHRVHPVTGAEFDYEHGCRTCAHFAVRTKRKVKIVCCALAPELDGETFGGQVREAFPACERWTRRVDSVNDGMGRAPRVRRKRR